jgi:hypothetical protein
VEEEYKNPMGREVARLSHKHVMRLSEASREEKGESLPFLPLSEAKAKINGTQQQEE